MPTYDQEVLADTPNIYWKLQDTSGTSAVDSSGNTRPGTYNGTAAVNYALAQNVSLVSSDPTAKSVKMMRDSAVEGGHPTLRTNLADSTTVNGKSSISRAYESWMNAAGVAFSVEAWVRVPATLNRYSSRYSMFVAVRRLTPPLQWGLPLVGFGAAPNFTRWEAVLATAYGQPAYTAGSFSIPETADETALGAPSTAYESVIEDVPQYTRYGDWFDSQPHHILGACGASSIRLYADGLLGIIYYASNVPAIASNTTDPLIFGGLSTSGNMLGLMGWMSHCAHYPSELSAARAAAHFTAGGTKVTFLNQQWQLLAATEMLVADSATLADGLVTLQRQIIALAEMSTFTSDLTVAARQAILLAESAVVDGVFSVRQQLSVAFIDALSISDQLSQSRFAQMLLSSMAVVNDVLAPNSRTAMTLADVITAAVSIRAGDQEWVGWVINPNLKASVGLDNYGFSGFGEHKGRYYGVKPDGIYALDGDTDNGAAIESFISLGNRDFGTPKMKRVSHAYIGAASDGTMVLRVITSGQEYLYEARNPTTDMAEQRIDIGKGLRGNYWNFELMNQNGENFDINTIKFMPVVLERRI